MVVQWSPVPHTDVASKPQRRCNDYRHGLGYAGRPRLLSTPSGGVTTLRLNPPR